MKSREQITQQVRSGAINNREADTELLLDLRELAMKQLVELETLTARWRKPGRPRKKKAASG